MFGFSIVGLKNTMAMRSEIVGLAILCWVFQGSGLWAQQDLEVVSPTVQQLEFFESKIRPVLVDVVTSAIRRVRRFCKRI